MTTDKQLLHQIKNDIEEFFRKEQSLIFIEYELQHRLASFLEQPWRRYDKVWYEYFASDDCKDRTDLIVEKEGKFVAIELKYKRTKIKIPYNPISSAQDKHDLLSGPTAQTELRGDFIKDVKKIVKLITTHKKIVGGFAVILSNDYNFWKSKNNIKNPIGEGAILPEGLPQSRLTWTKANITMPSQVTFETNQPTEFRYCMVCCERNYTPVKNSSLLTYIPKK